MAMYPADVQRLAEMLSPPEDSNSDDEDKRLPSVTRSLGPADIAAPQAPQELQAQPQGRKEKDDRLVPEVILAYSQEVRPEDIFLGFGLRTPGSASCESLRVTLRMPDENAELVEIDAQVDFERNFLELRSPCYHLSLPLPQPVDPRASLHRAQWDVEKRELTVTVRLRRDLDCTNF